MSHYSRYNITAEAEAVTTHGFHALAFMAEAAIFTYLGADFLLSDFDAEAWDWRLVTPTVLAETTCAAFRSISRHDRGVVQVALVIPLCLVARACSVFPITAAINCRRRRNGEATMGWRSQVVMWWAGLRGAIAYGLAKRWDAEGDSPPTEVTTAMAVIIFTTFGLGSTVATLIKCLGLDGKPDAAGPPQAAEPRPASSQEALAESLLGGMDAPRGTQHGAHDYVAAAQVRTRRTNSPLMPIIRQPVGGIPSLCDDHNRWVCVPGLGGVHHRGGSARGGWGTAAAALLSRPSPAHGPAQVRPRYTNQRHRCQDSWRLPSPKREA